MADSSRASSQINEPEQELRRLYSHRRQRQRQHKQGTEISGIHQGHGTGVQMEREQEQSASSEKNECAKGQARTNRGRKSSRSSGIETTVGQRRGKRGRKCSKDPVTEEVVVPGRGKRSSRVRRSSRDSVPEEAVGRGRGRKTSRVRRSSRDSVPEEAVGRGRGRRTSHGRGCSRDSVPEEAVGRGRGRRTSRGRGCSRDSVPEEAVVRGRGRKNSRGRGGRGRMSQQVSSRGRGAVPSRPKRKGPRFVKIGYSEEDMTRVAVLQQRRSQAMHERLGKMRVKELRHLLECIITREPGMVFDVLESSSSINPGQSPPSPSSNPLDPWCTCGRCREMPSDIERKCCGLLSPECVSILPEFDLFVIEPTYLRQFNRYRGQVYGIPGLGDNASMRHAAYTQFILLKHGKLGHRNRRVIPSCCVWQIRTTFPEQSGVYRSFIPSNLN